MNRPTHLTITGLDNKTDLVACSELSQRYPLEWGVLLSASKQGKEPRYPNRITLDKIFWHSYLRLSLHLCGKYARDVMSRTMSYENFTEVVLKNKGNLVTLPQLNFRRAQRIQINHPNPDANIIGEFGRKFFCQCIAQSRSLIWPNPAEDNICVWLYDCSGGRGIPPKEWPKHPGEDFYVGYSGGISPENLATVLLQVASPYPYWLDVESGARTGNWLDLNKVAKMCAIIWPEK